jgi:cysteine-rich repeat protein
MKCVVCADPLCRTCDNPTQCSSCVSGYTLVETTQTCAPNVGYYLDASSVLRACNYSLAGCLNCSADGATCALCQDGYYLSGSACATCSGIYPDCSKCNTTSCIDCLTPKVLINGTLCSDPIPSQTIVVPSTPRGPCTDTNCFECSATNVSNCIVCKSNLYILQDGKCNTVCGDSLIDGSDVCDDGNQISFDGCSADCKTLEDGFVCNKVPSQLPGYLTTQCYFGRPINLSIASIEKPLT